MFSWLGGKKGKSKKPAAALPGADPSETRKALQEQALAQFRQTEAAFGKDTIQQMKMALEKMSARDKLLKQLEGVSKEVVADHLKEMVRAEKDALKKK